MCVAGAPAAIAEAADPLPCGEAAKAVLALDNQAPELVTERTFGKKTGERGLTLIYDVTGCEMPEDAPPIQDPPAIFDAETGEPIPEGALRLKAASVEGARYVVRLKVSSHSVHPGSYTGFVEMKADWLTPIRTPVAVSRSEENFLWPLACGAAGAAVGFLIFMLLHAFKNDKLLVNSWQLVTAAVFSVGAGALAALITNYSNQEIWVLADNWWGAAGVGFTAATSGAMAVLLAPVFMTDTAAHRGST